MRKTPKFVTLPALAGALLLGGLAIQPADAAKPAHQHQKAAKAIYVCPMDPQVIAHQPGRCPECKMHLTKVTAEYYCTMHPEVTSSKAGRCPECKMHFVKAQK